MARLAATLLALLALLAPSGAPADAPRGGLTDVTAATGLDFTHVNGMTGDRYLAEVMGAGIALVDVDGDGRLDLYVVQGGSLEEDGGFDRALFPPPPRDTPPRDRLFRNVPAPDGVGWRFVDVTDAAGLDATEYGMGVHVGDANGDGWPDLFLANYGRDRLFLNRGDGTFLDATDDSGLGTTSWSSGATWFDADGDGDLDLYVSRYVVWDLSVHQLCDWFGGREDYCGPLTFEPLDDLLHLNDGTGRFVEAGAAAGIAGARGTGLAVIAGDWNEDGRPDLFVANDAMPNFLWVNIGAEGTDGDASDAARGDARAADAPSLAPPRFVEMGLDLGVALGAEGFPEGSMGIAAGDVDADGDEDLLLTHFTLQKNTFYRNAGGGVFLDQSAASGLDWPSRPWTGFGVGWLELDGDGWPDLFVANGAVHSLADRVAAGDPFPLGQRNQVFRNRAGRGFEDVSTSWGDGLAPIEVSRGVAFGDLDDDGDTDLVVANNNGPARVLRNDLLPARAAEVAWLGLDLRRPAPRAPGRTTPALGARADLRLADGRVLTRWVRIDGSYAASSDPRVLFHWARAAGSPVALRIAWRTGEEPRDAGGDAGGGAGDGAGGASAVVEFDLTNAPAALFDRYHAIVEGAADRGSPELGASRLGGLERH